MSNHIRLPAERVEQLRLIANAKNMTIPEVIAGFVRSEVQRGTIPADLPGVTVAKEGVDIIITGNGFEAKIPHDTGPTVADLLQEGTELNGSDSERRKRWVAGLANLSGISIKRAGNGIKLVSPITGAEYPLNLDIAVDLADQIRKSAE